MYTVLDQYAYMYQYRIMGRCSPGTGAIFVIANASVLQHGLGYTQSIEFVDTHISLISGHTQAWV